MKTGIMYIEDKDGLVGDGRICRVQFSKTGKTFYYQGMEFQSLKGIGYKSSYFEVKSGIEYWVSKPSKDGNVSLYPEIEDTQGFDLGFFLTVSEEYLLSV